MLSRILKITFLLFAISANLPAEQPADVAVDKSAMADGFALGGTVGEVRIKDDSDKVMFCPAQKLQDDTGFIEKNSCIEVLKGGSLEVLQEALAAKETLEIKAWGLITRYEGENYAYINYALPLIKNETGSKENQQQSETDKSGSSEEDSQERIIPENALAKLRDYSQTVSAESLEVFEKQTRDGVYVDKTGLIKKDARGRIYFSPDGLGRNINTEKYYILKSRELKKALEQNKQTLQGVRFNVAGLESDYKGEKYLLLQRAAKTHNYGNLSDF